MSSEITLFEKMKLAMEETRDESISSLMKRYCIIKGILIWMDKYSSMLCASYLLPCDNCRSEDHINYQCEYNVGAILETYNNCDKFHASMELLEFVFYTGAGELLARFRDIKEEDKSLDLIYGEVHPIYYLLMFLFPKTGDFIT
jgi:hypothetical protein